MNTEYEDFKRHFLSMMKPPVFNWDALAGKPMVIPWFIYGRDDIDVDVLQGFCRGYGALVSGLEDYHDTIGIYTAEGVYYNIHIDTRMECAVPQFWIDEEPYRYPIVTCYTMCGGLPAVDPATGHLRTN